MNCSFKQMFYKVWTEGKSSTSYHSFGSYTKKAESQLKLILIYRTIYQTICGFQQRCFSDKVDIKLKNHGKTLGLLI